MANVQKFARAAMGHICAHYERAKNEDGEYIRFGNQNIDVSKTPLNYNLAPDHDGGQVGFIRQRTSEVKCLKRADVNVMCSWIVTLPQGFSRDREFFEAAYDFLSERYGNKNVISAYVHMDEVQPHMHFSFVPVVVGKNDIEKVSAKELLTKAELQRFHPALQTAMERVLGREVPVLNGATAGGNRTVAEMKAEQEIAMANAAAEKARKEAEAVKGEVNHLKGQKRALQSDVEALQATIMTEREVLALQGKKTLTGALKGVTFDDYKNLRETALRVGKVDAERDRAVKRAIAEKDKEKARADAAEAKVAKAEKRARDAMDERPSLKTQLENAEMKHRLENIERWLKRLVTLIPEPFKAIINKILRNEEPFPQERRQSREHDRGMEL